MNILKGTKNNRKKPLRNLLWFLWSFLSMAMLTSCFTGIESTKKINLSREDRKLTAPTPEEKFFPGLPGQPLKDWDGGKAFRVTDDRAIMIFEIATPFYGAPDSLRLKGKTFYYAGTHIKPDAAGNSIAILKFTDGDYFYFYDTGKESQTAGEHLKSSDIPMLIDLDIVKEANEKLTGQVFWTKSNLWYNAEEERIPGKKYTEVKVEEVMPGNMVFPLLLKLSTLDGTRFYVLMNLGNSDKESRSFHTLFSLSDIKKQYPDITPENWELICSGKVSIGMTKLECRLALGNPIEIAAGHDYSQTLDIWTYDNGRILWFEDGKLSKFKG